MELLNTKDADVIADALALAELLGTSAAEAVRLAVRERLARGRVGHEAEKRRRYQAIMAVADGASKLFPPGASSGNTDLYDENGLPR